MREYPDRCKGDYPSNRGTGCVANGGRVSCTYDGDYMCCHDNDQGWQDCEEIVGFKKPKDRVTRIPGGGKLQVAPGDPVPNTFPFQRPGGILQRGVEGEPATTAPTGQEDKAPAPK